MIFPRYWVPLVVAAVALWQESGENPAVFCYLIGWGTLATFRSRTLAPIPISVRHESACWNPPVTSFTHSTTPKGSDS
jgi:hypothetical protein